MKKTILALAVFAAALCASGQDSLSGIFYVTPGFTLTQTNGASALQETVGRVIAQNTAYGTNGTVASPQMNAWFGQTGTLTNGQERILSCAALTNGFGQAMDLWRVNLLIVHSTGTNNVDALAVGGIADHLPVMGDTNQTSVVRPGGVYVASAPDAAGIVATGKVIRLANLGTNSLSYAVYVGGAR